MFGCQRTESVEAVMLGLGRLNVMPQLLVCKAKFYKCHYLKTGLLHNVILVSLLTNSICGDGMITMFRPLCSTVDDIYL